jgi:hypothetical protein
VTISNEYNGERVCVVHRVAWCKKCFPTVDDLADMGHYVAPSALLLRHRNSAERKAEPIHSGVLLYFPDALAAIARVSLKANEKHNPGEPMHWARGKSMDQLDSAVRHTLTPDEVDPETGEIELAQCAWRALAELQLREEKRLLAAGIVPYSGVTNATK